MLQPVPVDRSVGTSIGKRTGSTKRPSDHVQEHSSEEEIHDQVTKEAKRNDVKESKEGLGMTT